MKLNYYDVWNFVHEAEQVSFPKDIKESMRLVAECRFETEPWVQYRLYLDLDNNTKKYSRISLTQ